MNDERDVRRTAIAVAFFILGCAAYLAVTIPLVIEFWEVFVATLGAGPISVTMVLAGTIGGAAAIRWTVRLTNDWERS